MPSTPCISYLVKLSLGNGGKEEGGKQRRGRGGTKVLDTNYNKVFVRLFVCEVRKRLGCTSCI